jgi:hypothetical protein
VNRHLNVFVPYCLPPNHEDQLTRAAMIVLRSVPQAAEELLLRIGAHSLGQLPAMEIDMQAKSVATGSEVDELVSVFLTPDQEQSENHGFGVTHSDRAQRLDGVLRFEPAMVVVVESKVYERRDAWQAHNINLDGVTASSSRVVVLRWHDLIGDWLRLLEGNVLSLAERILINDLLDLADLEFPMTMPFSSLRLADGHQDRLMRRLRVLMLEATGIAVEPKIYDHAHVRLDTALGTQSLQRAALGREDSSEDSRLILAVWPGELKAQAQRLYSNQRAQAVASLANEDGWEVVGTPHLAFRNAKADKRWYLTTRVGADEYATIWEENFKQVGGHRAEELPKLLDWLLDQRLASKSDLDGRDQFERVLAGRPIHLRAGLRVQRSWTWEEALRLDDAGLLAAAIRGALGEVLTRLDEPALAPLPE